MAEQETKTVKFAGKKNRYRFNNRGNQTTKTNYKSKVTELEDKVFDLGASSDSAKFSKSLKNIEKYIQKNYKTCDDIVKAIQQLKHPTLAYPKQPTKSQYTESMGTLTTTRSKWQSFCGKMTTKRRKTEWISIMTMNQTH